MTPIEPKDGARSARVRNRLRSLASRCGGTFGFYVKYLGTGEVVALRADEAFPAASVIKVPILLAALSLVQEGTATLEQRIRLTGWHRTGGSGVFQHFDDGLEVTLADACHAMTTLSDNTATNMVLDVTGIDGVNRLLDEMGCRVTRLHRYFGKPDMAGPAGPSQAVPREIGVLFERLAMNELLTPVLCRRALLFLRRQTHRALVPRLLPEGTVVAHKTGSLDGVRHDAGLIWARQVAGNSGPKRDLLALPDDGLPDWPPIVFVGMSKGVPDLRWTVENRAEVTIARAARAVYDAFVPPGAGVSG